MKNKSIILSIILGAIAGPLQMGIIYLLIGKNEKNNLFVFIGLLLAFIVVYRIFLAVFYRIVLKNYSYDDREECKTRTVWISKVSLAVTYFVMLYYIANEGLITSVILTIVMVGLPSFTIGLILSPFADFIGENSTENKEKTNHFGFRKSRTYLKNEFGKIVGTADKISYDGKYGGWERTEYKDNNGKVIVKEDTHKF